MTSNTPRASRPLARIEYLKVKNYRALREVEFKDLTRFTVLLGPNGSGKSTVFDIFAFLAECFELGLRRAWDRRGRARELKTRGGEGPISIEIKYREPGYPLITYHLAVDERAGAPVVVEEWLRWKRGSHGQPFRFLEYREGHGKAVSGEQPDEQDRRIEIPLKSADLLAVNALGQFADHPRVAALRDFITGWYVSYLSAESARGQPEAGPQERLTRSGDNIANVIQYLAEQHGKRLEKIFEVLRRRVPRIERVLAETMPDGRLLLQIKDAPFSHPVLAKFASDGTLKMLAYLDLAVRPGAAALHRYRRAGELPSPKASRGAGRGMPHGHRPHPAAGDHPFSVLSQRPAAGGSAGAVAGRAGLHEDRARSRSAGCEGVRRSRRLARAVVDGRTARRWRPAREPGRPDARETQGLTMTATHLEVLVEEPSMEAFLRALLPRLLPQDRTFEVRAFQGKTDLLAKLEGRLCGYAAWIPDDWRILVVVDRDDEDCHRLKRRMESAAHTAGLRSRSVAKMVAGSSPTVSPSRSWKRGTSATGRQSRPLIHASHPLCHDERASVTRTASRAAPGRPSSGSCSDTVILGVDYRRSRPRVRSVPMSIQSAALRPPFVLSGRRSPKHSRDGIH